MALCTAFTELFGIGHPIALAPMGGTAGGALAAAVSEGGGLGLVGAGGGDPVWLERELAIVGERTDRPWGVGFLSWAASPALVERALEYRPHAVMLSFGDPRPLAALVLAAGVPLIVQVTDLDEAEQALDVGAHMLVAQGCEAGGHGGRRATLPFVPVVVDLAGPTPVLAAGGVADGRGLGAVLVLGAAGALVGTRFQASAEALVAPEVAKAIIEARGDDSERSRVLDIARGSPWPSRYTGRTLRNTFLDRWRGREAELEADEQALAGYRAAAEHGDLSVLPVWAGEAVDLITAPSPRPSWWPPSPAKRRSRYSAPDVPSGSRGPGETRPTPALPAPRDALPTAGTRTPSDSAMPTLRAGRCEELGSGQRLSRRPGLAAALVDVETGPAEAVVVAKLDRLSRSLIDFAALMQRAQRRGWNLVAVDLDIDLSSPHGELFATMATGMALWERRMIGDRTKAALAARRAAGARLGRPPTLSQP